MEVTNEFHKDHQTLVVVRAVADVMGDSNCTKRKWEKVDYIWLEETYGEFWIDNVEKELSQVKDLMSSLMWGMSKLMEPSSEEESSDSCLWIPLWRRNLRILILDPLRRRRIYSHVYGPSKEEENLFSYNYL